MRTVLLADNDPDFLSTRAEFLEEAGYRVLQADSPELARKILDTTHVHLAILDVRLVDDEDDRDTTGISIASELRYRPVPKIILTEHPSVELTRQALRPRADGPPFAFNFVKKIEGPDKMIEAAEQAIAEHAGVNWDLTIARDRRGGVSLLQLVDAVDSPLGLEELPDRIGEMEDLFRGLFYDCRQVTLSRLFWSMDGRAAIAVFAFQEKNVGEYVVCCGGRQVIEAELSRRRRFAPPLYNMHGSTSAHTVHYAGAAWPFPGTDLQHARTFARFFRERPDREIGSVWKGLYGSTLVDWHGADLHAGGERSAAQSYRERLGLNGDGQTRADLERRIDYVVGLAISSGLASISRSPGRLVYELPRWPPEECPDPVSCLFDDGGLPDCRAVHATAPGGIDVRTLLVDADRRPWLTDLAHAGTAPVCQDFVSLEAGIRFDLMEACNLVTLLDFEKALSGTARLGEMVPLADVEPECRRALRAILAIRARAVDVTGDDPLPYYIGLLFWTAAGLAWVDPEVRQTKAETVSLVHRLLLSALLCRKIAELGTTAREPQVLRPTGGLRIDEDSHEVQVGGKPVALTPTEYELLLYFSRHSGKLCRRRDILHEVFSIAEPTDQQVKSLVNSPMSRLRSKIELDPAHTYIVTVRGEGYRFVPRPPTA